MTKIIIKRYYSNGNISYIVKEKNFRGGFDSMYDKLGNEIEFDTFSGAYKFADPDGKNNFYTFVIKEEKLMDIY